ncbi:TetR family transcriptional regulator [Nocardioides alcanivorans]|uniref:TetR family transcriptional regulator n=1 Tax=Nocardioides alcanivorans TaxID=2897352 RepID=UPI001F1DCAB9|nr:TetR family transcriptional regulator [Nocardioides alcanivorans]
MTPTPAAESRQEKKDRTRRSILDTALDLLADSSFGALSLRQLTKAVGIVPTAFYRHFTTLDELGLALVDESFVSLRTVLSDVRREELSPDTLIDVSVGVLTDHLAADVRHFRFLCRERYGGVAAVSEAIRHELQLFERELARDLARMPDLAPWGARDLALLAGLFVNLMVSAAGEFVSSDDPRARARISETLRHQARMAVVGAAGWTPSASDQRLRDERPRGADTEFLSRSVLVVVARGQVERLLQDRHRGQLRRHLELA